LLELVITLALIAILVGVVSFRSSSVLEKGRVSAIVQLAKNLQTACVTFNSDTGLYAEELPGYAATRKDLSADQTTVAGWAGPYIDKPLANPGSNPYGNCYLYRQATSGNNAGYDLDADGTPEITGNACSLRLDSITQEVAQRIDEALDKGFTGTWTGTGNVNYDAARQRVHILVFH